MVETAFSWRSRWATGVPITSCSRRARRPIRRRRRRRGPRTGRLPPAGRGLAGLLPSGCPGCGGRSARAYGPGDRRAARDTPLEAFQAVLGASWLGGDVTASTVARAALDLPAAPGTPDPADLLLTAHATQVLQGSTAAPLLRAAMTAMDAERSEQASGGVRLHTTRTSLAVLENGSSHYSNALAVARQEYAEDPVYYGNPALVEMVEAGVHGGDHDAARAALLRLTPRASAAGTPWALGLLTRSPARRRCWPRRRSRHALPAGPRPPPDDRHPDRTRPPPPALRGVAQTPAAPRRSP